MATRLTPAPARTGIPSHLKRLFVLLVCLALIAALAACTRDRPAPTPEPGSVEVVPASGAGSGIELVVPSAQDATPVPEAVGGGDPIVVASTPDPAEEGAAGEPGAEVIEEYEVQQGDSLLSIALDFDTTVERLRELNFMSSDLIQVGQFLRVPVIPPPPTPTPSPFYHVVAAGESLSQIAAMYSVGQIQIINANRLSDPNALRAGMELLIPDYMPESAALEGGEAGSEEEGAAPVDPGEQATHEVQPGETLNQIAVLYGIPTATLAQANSITNLNQLRTGQVLVIPGMTVQDALDLRAQRHIVKAGESLSEIARDYGVTMRQIIDRNKLSNPNAISPGQELIIPAPE